MIAQATGGKSLPAEVVQQIVAKTDGVPLFVEELTKTVMESDLLREIDGHYELSGPLPPLAIPSTLQDSLMARLDRLASVREIAQLGATIGREFSYDLLQAVSPLDTQLLQNGLRQLVATELVYQRGTPPQSTYFFKHALIQDTAYQSLLKSRRQQLHQQIAQVLEVRFPDTKDTQPELLAHHYTEAGLIAQAIPYWQQAGQQASQHSAYVEAVSHLTRALDLLKTLPESPARARQELSLQTALGISLIPIRGYTVPEVGHLYTRARELCEQLGERAQLFTVLRGLWIFHLIRAEYETAHKLAYQGLQLAQELQDATLLFSAYQDLGFSSLWPGEWHAAREYFERTMTFYDPQQHQTYLSLYEADLGVWALCESSIALWCLGYPNQAQQKCQEALTLVKKFAHPNTRGWVLLCAAWLHQYLWEPQKTQEQTEATIALSHEHGFPLWLAWGTILQGWALTMQGQTEIGTTQIHQGITAAQAMKAEQARSHHFALLAEALSHSGQIEEGLAVLTEALQFVEQIGERVYEAELYRLYGELSLRKGKRESGQTGEEKQIAHSPIPPFALSSPEECFLKAIEVAQKQNAKSLELRAVMSLVRLRQQQAALSESRNTQHEARIKLTEAHRMLSEVYNWFTEGFDTKDLQEAKSLLDALA
jgi:predicted ATPase